MKKRGISPLIATVLIIGFTIVLAAVVFMWGTGVFTGYQKTTAEQAKADLQCAQTFFNVKTACNIGNNTWLQLENTGQTDIDSFLYRYKGKEIQPEELPLKLSRYSSIYTNIHPDTDQYRLENFELFPKVLVDGKEFICEKGVKKDIKDCFQLLGLKSANDFCIVEGANCIVSETYADNPGAKVSVLVGTKEKVEEFLAGTNTKLLTNYELGEKTLGIIPLQDISDPVIIKSNSFEIPDDPQKRIKKIAIYGEISNMNTDISLVKDDGTQDIILEMESPTHTTSYIYKKDISGLLSNNNYHLEISIYGNSGIAYSNIFRLCYTDDSGECVI